MANNDNLAVAYPPIDHADWAMRLSPFDPYSNVFSLARGISHLLQRQLPEAVAWLRKSAQENPRNASTFLWLGSALAHAGHMEEARAAIRRLLDLHPMSGARWWREHRRHREEDTEYLLEGACWPVYRSDYRRVARVEHQLARASSTASDPTALASKLWPPGAGPCEAWEPNSRNKPARDGNPEPRARREAQSCRAPPQRGPGLTAPEKGSSLPERRHCCGKLSRRVKGSVRF
jgi:tetratricopeptide (TPR) repeat protein